VVKLAVYPYSSFHDQDFERGEGEECNEEVPETTAQNEKALVVNSSSRFRSGDGKKRAKNFGKKVRSPPPSYTTRLTRIET
jgi:hypothetical protein